MSTYDPGERREEDLPDKPRPQEADLPEDGLDVDDLEPEEVPEADFLTPGDARDDQTVDDTEDDTTPGE